ncbi:MAG: DUF4160 domain-containing protein [Candidatus Sericytochromatia bacterium]|nr:DUF4160 domain-containing protein [Candidatus Tanganyikabacteria bacterium]
MPEISRFFGISITMNFDDHNPPHFHVQYGDQQGIVRIAPCTLMDGRLSPRVLGLVMEWAALHQAELEANWNRARSRRPLERIAPLE